MPPVHKVLSSVPGCFIVNGEGAFVADSQKALTRVLIQYSDNEQLRFKSLALKNGPIFFG